MERSTDGRRDEGEFTAFASACRGQLRRTAFLICGDWERAADGTQEALVRLYVAWPRLERSTQLAAYARRTVVNIAIDQCRRRWQHEVVGIPPDVPDRHDGSGNVVERVVLLEALAKLPPRQWACVVLRY